MYSHFDILNKLCILIVSLGALPLATYAVPVTTSTVTTTYVADPTDPAGPPLASSTSNTVTSFIPLAVCALPRTSSKVHEYVYQSH